MPIYEYHCAACGHSFDALQKASDAPLTACPECHRETLSKGVSAPAFHLRGKGWRSPSAVDKAAAARKKPRVGHLLDSATPHSHDDDAPHKSGGGHTHSHGGVTHSHGPGHKHDH